MLIGTECKDESENCKSYESACFLTNVQEYCPKTCKACDIIGNICYNNDYYYFDDCEILKYLKICIIF